MNDRGSVQELFNLIKTVVDNYMKSRKPAAVLVGTYTGNAKSQLVSGDKVRLLRNDRGHEYYILEIIGKPYQTAGGT